MYIKNSALILITLSFLSFMPNAHAEEGKINPVIEAYQEFTADFDDTSVRHFGVLYGNYNLIQVVKTVRTSVDGAITACGEKNPEMKKALANRFQTWTGDVNPLIQEADENVNNMILVQDYAKSKDIRHFLKQLDDERTQRNAEANKVPVTTPEACQHLLKQMSSTQDNMVNLLRATLVSLPRAMQIEEKAKATKTIEDAKPPKEVAP